MALRNEVANLKLAQAELRAQIQRLETLSATHAKPDAAMHDLRDLLDKLQQRVQQLEMSVAAQQQYNTLETRLAQLEQRQPGLVDPKTPVYHIILVHQELPIVTIDVGRSEGVERGESFDIYDGNRKICTASALLIQESGCSATLDDVGRKVGVKIGMTVVRRKPVK